MNLNQPGTFINPKTLQMKAIIKDFTNVTITEEQKSIECRANGATYNQQLNRCEAYTSDACHGNYFDTTTGKCYKKPVDYCNAMGYFGYDEDTNRCYRYKTEYTNKVNTLVDRHEADYNIFLTINGYPTTQIYKNSTNYYVIINGNKVNIDIFDSNKNGVGVPYCSNTNYTLEYTSNYNKPIFLFYANYSDGNDIGQIGISNKRLFADCSYADILNDSGSSIYGTLYYGGKSISVPTLGTKTLPSQKDFFNIPTCSAWVQLIKTGIATIKGANCSKYSLQCPSGYTDNGANCYKTTIEYLNIPTNISSYTFTNNSINGQDAFIQTPSCTGKQMSVSPYSSTPHYGNNGICYSDLGLYCKTYATSTNKILLPNNKQIICWDNTQTCNDVRFNLTYDYSGNNDKCNKYVFSCNNKSRYGLAEHPTLNNAVDLFNRIGDNNTKNQKVLPYAAEIVNRQNIILNDNFGSICVENIESTYNNPSSITFTTSNKEKGGF